MEFRIRYFALSSLFSVIESFKWFWMGSLHENIQFMLEFLNTPFLILHFSKYTMMTFLMINSLIVLTMLVIVLYLYSKCDKASDLWQKKKGDSGEKSLARFFRWFWDFLNEERSPFTQKIILNCFSKNNLHFQQVLIC